MSMIKLYKASSFKYTPFDDFEEGDLDYLNQNNIVIVDNVNRVKSTCSAYLVVIL